MQQHSDEKHSLSGNLSFETKHKRRINCLHNVNYSADEIVIPRQFEPYPNEL
jgi:hypothetical protein